MLLFLMELACDPRQFPSECNLGSIQLHLTCFFFFLDSFIFAFVVEKTNIHIFFLSNIGQVKLAVVHI